jgi:hypothetical protein
MKDLAIDLALILASSQPFKLFASTMFSSMDGMINPESRNIYLIV